MELTVKNKIFFIISFVSIIVLAVIWYLQNDGLWYLPLLQRQFILKDNNVDNNNSSLAINPFSSNNSLAINRPLPDKYFLVVMTIAKNQAPYFPEWIEFHLAQGVSRFVIYDHQSSDNTADILKPYIELGVVEMVSWPRDHDTVEAKSGLPREWIDGNTTRETFERYLHYECITLPTGKTWHLQDGCQRSAFIDAISRYRKKSEWYACFDVDEFMFVPLSSPHANKTTPLVQLLTSNEMSRFVNIEISGGAFGTQGFLDDIPGLSPDLPFTLVIELYRYRSQKQDQAIKSFVRARVAKDCPVHFFYTIVTGEILHTSTDIRYNHYQYRSVLGAHRKAVTNGNPEVEYNTVLDHRLSESAELDIARYVPVVRKALQLRLQANFWNKYPSFPLSVNYNKSAAPKSKDVCFIATNFNAEFHHLRRAISTTKLHMDLFEKEKGYVFHTFILTRAREISEVMTSFNFHQMLPDVAALSASVSIVQEKFGQNWFKKFVEACAGFQYLLILGEKMETSLVVPDSMKKGATSSDLVHDSSVITQAVLLLEDGELSGKRVLLTTQDSDDKWMEVTSNKSVSKVRYYRPTRKEGFEGQLIPLKQMPFILEKCFASSPTLDDDCYRVTTMCFSQKLDNCQSKNALIQGLLFINS